MQRFSVEFGGVSNLWFLLTVESMECVEEMVKLSGMADALHLDG